MAKRPVISMLEFLRTGVLGEITCGATTEDVMRVLGEPWYKAQSPFVRNVSWFSYDSLELWFHEETQIISRMTLQRFRPPPKGRYCRLFNGSRLKIPSIPRVNIEPWVLYEGLDVNTLMRYLRTAGLEYAHSQWKALYVHQLNLESGVILFCDPDDSDTPEFNYSDTPGLSYIEFKDELLFKQIENETWIAR
jgi:hypothetical protein